VREDVIAATRRWIESAVLGLKLCPFAPAPYIADRVRIVVSEHALLSSLLGEVKREARELLTGESVETTLIVYEHALGDFGDYERFFNAAEAELRERGLGSDLALASFHPDYVFDDSDPADVANATNRSPYPILHLIRESSLERARAAGDTDLIWQRNVRTMRALGAAGWDALRDSA
jgi:hypothetical protein